MKTLKKILDTISSNPVGGVLNKAIDALEGKSNLPSGTIPGVNKLLDQWKVDIDAARRENRKYTKKDKRSE